MSLSIKVVVEFDTTATNDLELDGFLLKILYLEIFLEELNIHVNLAFLGANSRVIFVGFDGSVSALANQLSLPFT